MEYIAIGSMSGTSLDGVDISIIKSNGKDTFTEIDNYFHPYPKDLITSLKSSINQNYLVDSKLPTLISNEYNKAIEHIVSKNKSIQIDVIGIHGQTIFHDEKLKISIQIFDKKKIKTVCPFLISNFRKNDLLNGGTGAPIIPIFHKLIAEKFKLNNCMFVNIGGVTNITNIKENHIDAYDLCFGNALSDDLVNLSDKNFSYDNDGDFSRGGSLIKQIEKIILSDPYFSKSSPKSLDRNYFHKYFNIITEHSHRSLKDTLFTLWNILGSKILYASNNSKIILCGGGRKNSTLKEILNNLKLNVIDVDELGINGDFIESQGIGYLAIRRLLKLPSSFDKTTGIKKETFLGEIN
ncbi:MAG: hypothetical protein CMI90_03875 [Pelagibacteraceae bacterium]|nr:hypothetical protein [Pelagibacteraceae bacterium]|tara:strand:- start:32 stop:1084 length:1053 start_codon:yes stop_codon:yes gene_type:complete